jgi:hypothetical protein
MNFLEPSLPQHAETADNRKKAEDMPGRVVDGLGDPNAPRPNLTKPDQESASAVKSYFVTTGLVLADSAIQFYIGRLRGMGLKDIRVIDRKWMGWDRVGVRPWIRGGDSPCDIQIFVGDLADHHQYAADTYASATRYRFESTDAARAFVCEWDGIRSPGDQII